MLYSSNYQQVFPTLPHSITLTTINLSSVILILRFEKALANIVLYIFIYHVNLVGLHTQLVILIAAICQLFSCAGHFGWRTGVVQHTIVKRLVTNTFIYNYT